MKTISKAILSLVILLSSTVAWAQQLEAPDLVITSVRLDPAFPTPGSTVQIIATVANQGTRTTNDVFAVEFKADRVQIGVRFLADLAPGQSLEVPVSWDAKPGETVLRVSVDPFKTVSELDESNNAFYKIVNATTREFTGADLVVHRVSIEADSLVSGGPAHLVATVANIGEGPAAFVSVGFYVDGELLAVQTLQESLPAGQEVSVAIPWTVEVGEKVLRAKADPNGELFELDEANNAWAEYFEFAPMPNRCAQIVSLEFASTSITLLEEMTSLPSSDLMTVFIPAIRRQMERDYEGVNVRFYLRQPTGIFSTVFFSPENRIPILGLAPLDFGNLRKDDRGFVFVGSFHVNRGLRLAPPELLAILFAKVASHELGHMLGLNHNPDGGIMNAQAEINPYLVQNEKFRAEDLEYLKRILPMDCR
ncbi:MAG: CARDB domain-containing protein [Candidatus Bipolaricaulia bacterium]